MWCWYSAPEVVQSVPGIAIPTTILCHFPSLPFSSNHPQTYYFNTLSSMLINVSTQLTHLQHSLLSSIHPPDLRQPASPDTILSQQSTNNHQFVSCDRVSRAYTFSIIKWPSSYLNHSLRCQTHKTHPTSSASVSTALVPDQTTIAGMDMRNGEGRKVTPEGTYSNGQSNSATPHSTQMSPFGSPAPKSIAFELLFTNSPQFRSRLPLRVMIHAHDTTESIVTTVKNFYGLYNGPTGTKGVSFEDNHGNTIIARYENLTHHMVVYVRVIDETVSGNGGYDTASFHTNLPVAQQTYHSDMPPPQPSQMLSYGQTTSRPQSRTSRKRSVSPNSGRGRRSASANLNPSIKKNRSRSGYKSRGSSTHGSFEHSDGLTGYSSGDGGPGSVSSRTKSEHIGNTEISLDNIVEGGRRKRAKFESSVSHRFTY